MRFWENSCSECRADRDLHTRIRVTPELAAQLVPWLAQLILSMSGGGPGLSRCAASSELTRRQFCDRASSHWLRSRAQNWLCFVARSQLTSVEIPRIVRNRKRHLDASNSDPAPPAGLRSRLSAAPPPYLLSGGTKAKRKPRWRFRLLSGLPRLRPAARQRPA
jgi:hypothetical protein